MTSSPYAASGPGGGADPDGSAPGGSGPGGSAPVAPAASFVAGTAASRFGHGLVIGTFYPPHVGHLALIRSALSRCDRVTVEVLGGSTESIPVPLRVEWLREEVPTARVTSVVDDAEIDFASASAWEHHTGVIRGLLDPADGPVEACFTSDAYGEELAARLGAEWVRVDADRSSLTVSSTAVRADVAGMWWAMPAPVREYLSRKVVVLGDREASAVLVGALAAHLGVPAVMAPDDVLHADEQPSAQPADGGETAASPAGSELALLWQRIRVETAARRTPRPLLVAQSSCPLGDWRPDLYLVAGDAPDPLRTELAGGSVPWVELGGGADEQVASGIREVEALLARGWGLAPSLEQQQQVARQAPRDAAAD